MQTAADLWSVYGPYVGFCFLALMVIVLLYALVDALSSISRTMNRAFKLWDESDRALHDFRRVISQLEALAEEKSEEKTRRAE